MKAICWSLNLNTTNFLSEVGSSVVESCAQIHGIIGLSGFDHVSCNLKHRQKTPEMNIM